MILVLKLEGPHIPVHNAGNKSSLESCHLISVSLLSLQYSYITLSLFPKISPLVYMHYFSEILANLVFSIINLVLHGTGVFYEVEWQIWMIWRNKNENLKVKKCRCYKTLGTICSLRKCRWKANNYKWAHTSSYKIICCKWTHINEVNWCNLYRNVFWLATINKS